MVVTNYYSFNFDHDEKLEKLEISPRTIYIKTYPDGSHQGMFQYEGFEYSITCNNQSTLIHIIQNMKGLEQ